MTFKHTREIVAKNLTDDSLLACCTSKRIALRVIKTYKLYQDKINSFEFSLMNLNLTKNLIG